MVTPKDIPFKPDIIWASPPCQKFSVASLWRNWKDGKPTNQETINAIKVVETTIKIIDYLNPKYWFIENPRAMLRKTELMLPLNRNTVTYCQYGDTRMKPTDIWTNCSAWIPRKMCKNGDSCHISAPRGSKTGTQGLKNSVLRSVVPRELCLEIIKVCEKVKNVSSQTKLTEV